MSEARVGFPGREERVLKRVLPRLRARGQQMRGDSRGWTRSRLQRPADGEVEVAVLADVTQPIEDGLAIEVVGEPRRRGTRYDASLAGLVEQA